MWASLFLELTEYPWFRRLVWRPVYNHLAKKFPAKDWLFMNYGYDPLNESKRPQLEAGDEPHRYPLQLYHFLASQTPIQGKKVLEVGSGRGGGSYYLARYFNPAEIIGMDIAENAVAFSNENHKSPNLRYVAGNAEKIPFEDHSFDVVINVESSHAYGSIDLFFHEVKRILKPGGYFLITDMRDPKNIPAFEKSLLDSGLVLESQQVITPNVLKAIDSEDELKRARIARQVPPAYVRFFEEFGAVKGSQLEKDFMAGKLVYFRYVLRNDV